MYTVTGEDGQTQQYMMVCPKDMDQQTLIQTLVKQISSDPATKGGKKTIRITQQKGAIKKAAAAAAAVTPAAGISPSVVPASQRGTPVSSRKRNEAPIAAKAKRALAGASPALVRQTAAQAVTPGTQVSNDLFPSNAAATMMPVLKTIIEASECFESVIADLPIEPIDGSTRVYVRCNYCQIFRSSLNGDTWEAILNHILPVAKEEIQTSFYGDLGKNFIRSLRIQINGKQVVKSGGREINQCEVVLTHSLVCRKTKREFIVCNPDATFVANLAKHIRTTQPGASSRGNSLLCIFCNQPFTYEDYIKHIQPHLDAILATLNCFAGAYCSHSYESTIKAQHMCGMCQEPESADLRFLPCTKFSADYSCNKKLQFGIDCFREHYGDNGFLRLNTSAVGRCSVCKNTQQVYCAVFQISTTILGDDNIEQQNVDTQLSVCVNCQKQFINIVMKEQGFDDRLKMFQLRNMEQLCSVLRVILNQAAPICNEKKTLIYTVHENTNNPNSAVHLVKSAEVTQVNPITRLMALAESEIVGSKLKSSFVCDLCLFTVDLTSLVATPKEKQKNDMLLAIVLEHLVPHTESLMNVIASTASNPSLNLKYEIVSKVQDLTSNQSKIGLSLNKKFRSAHSNMEIAMDKVESKTIDNLRLGAKQEKRLILQGKNKAGQMVQTQETTTNVSQQVAEMNKFIDRHRGKFGVLAQTGCNTTLLGAYTECRLCSKFSFPDFRLTGALSGSGELPRNIDLCENCVETVLTLCLPTEPECLSEAEECLALGEARLVGHRLVLSNNLKKWLSLDGVNLIKKCIDDYEEAKNAANGNVTSVFLQGLKTHIAAVLKTCQKDEDIMHCTAGFCIVESFLNKGNEVLASLEKTIGGMPVMEKAKTEVQVTILARRPPGSKKKTITLGGSVAPRTPTVIKRNGGSVINLGAMKKADPEESISAIENFIKESSKESPMTSPPENLKLPAGIKITSTGKGMVKIRAVSDAPRSSGAISAATGSGGGRVPITTSPQKGTTSSAAAASVTTPTTSRGPGRPPGVSMVTLTANGVVRKVPEQRIVPDATANDNGGGLDMDDITEGDVSPPPKVVRKRGRPPSATALAAAALTPGDRDYRPPQHVAKKVRVASGSTAMTTSAAPAQPVVMQQVVTPKLTPQSPAKDSESDSETNSGSRGGRQRKAKKIFDL